MLSRVLALAVGGALMVGCGASSSESLGTSSAGLQTPVPIFRSIASEKTEHDLGIYEWRVYRGMHETIVTGYDGDGNARRGVALGTYAKSKTASPHFRLRMLDGSGTVIRAVFGHSSVAHGALDARQSLLLGDAYGDLKTAVDAIAKLQSSQTAAGVCTLGALASTRGAIACGTGVYFSGNLQGNAIASCVFTAKIESELANAACSTIMEDVTENSSLVGTPSDDRSGYFNRFPVATQDPPGSDSTDPSSSANDSNDSSDPSNGSNPSSDSTDPGTSWNDQSSYYNRNPFAAQAYDDATSSSADLPASIDNSQATPSAADQSAATSSADTAGSDTTCESCTDPTITTTGYPVSDTQQPRSDDQQDVSASDSDGDTSMSDAGNSGGDDSGYSDGGGDSGGDDSGGGGDDGD